MGQDSESIELQSDDAHDLKWVTAGEAQAVPAGSPLSAEVAGVSIDSLGADELELKLSPERKVPPLSTAEGTSVFDLGDDLLEKTAILSRADEQDVGGGGAGPSVVVPVSVISIQPEIIGEAVDFPQISVTLPSPQETVAPSAVLPVLGEPPNLSELGAGGFSHDLEEPDFLLSREKDSELSDLWARLAIEFQLDEHSVSDLKMVTSPDADCVEVGIAYLEMGLFDSALKQFVEARKQEGGGGLAVVPLEVQAHLGLNQAFLALDLIESVVGDLDLEAIAQGPLRAELQYWAARCCEVLGRDGEALAWLRLVSESVPGHRDTEQRLRTLNRGRP